MYERGSNRNISEKRRRLHTQLEAAKIEEEIKEDNIKMKYELQVKGQLKGRNKTVKEMGKVEEQQQ